MRKKSKTKQRGFTIIELLITMAIFGFLVYVITSVLIVIVQTTYTASQRATLRKALETTLKSISNDAQFAQNVTNCSNPSSLNNCISFSVPSISGTGSSVKQVTIYQNGANIEKSISVNGMGQTVIYELSPSNIQITGFSAIVSSSNIETTLTGSVDTGTITSSGKSEKVTLTIGGLIHFEH